jgi:hypothetical protein
MKAFFTILVLVCLACSQSGAQTQNPATSPASQEAAKAPSPSITLDKDALQNSNKAKAIIEQGIQALGGQTYLTIRDREQQGRSYGFHHGTPSGGGAQFWSFSQFPDKERVELTKERDIAQLFVGDKGWEITYKGPHPLEPKDLEDYLRRRRYSLDRILRTWLNDPGVVMLFEGNAIAAQHPALQVTLVNAQNESVSLYFDVDSHLPIKKSFEWRDPVDKQKNLEEKSTKLSTRVRYHGPYNVTRYFNGDMSNQRFQFRDHQSGPRRAMFDPNSGYNPNKLVKPSKH